MRYACGGVCAVVLDEAGEEVVLLEDVLEAARVVAPDGRVQELEQEAVEDIVVAVFEKPRDEEVPGFERQRLEPLRRRVRHDLHYDLHQQQPVEREWLWDAVRRELDHVPAVTQKKKKQIPRSESSVFFFFPKETYLGLSVFATSH